MAFACDEEKKLKGWLQGLTVVARDIKRKQKQFHSDVQIWVDEGQDAEHFQSPSALLKAIGQARDYMELDLPLLFTVECTRIGTRLRTEYTERHPHLTGLVEKVPSVVKLVNFTNLKEAGEVPKCKPRKEKKKT